MGYTGGSGSGGGGTVIADIVEADIQAIVDGLAGVNGRTLSDVEAYLSGSSSGPMTDLRDSTDYIEDYLSGNNSGPLTDIRDYTDYMEDYLSGSNGGPLTDVRDYLYESSNGYSAAQMLYELMSAVWNMQGYVESLQFDGNGRLMVTTS